MNLLKSIKILSAALLAFNCSVLFADTVTSGNSSEMNNASAPPAGGSAAPQTGGSSAAQPNSMSPGSQNPSPAASPSTPSSGASASPPTSGQPAAQPNTQPSSGQASQAAPQNKGSTSDSSIVSSIQADVATHHELTEENVIVTSKNGLVSLSGNVSSSNKASAYIEIAEAATGVKDVNPIKLTVNNAKLDSDVAITAKVKGTLVREKLYGTTILKPLGVKTKDGVVTLTGTVSSQKQIDNAIKYTKSIKGVSKVRSEIVVEVSK